MPWFECWLMVVKISMMDSGIRVNLAQSMLLWTINIIIIANLNDSLKI